MLWCRGGPAVAHDRCVQTPCCCWEVAALAESAQRPVAHRKPGRLAGADWNCSLTGGWVGRRCMVRGVGAELQAASLRGGVPWKW